MSEAVAYLTVEEFLSIAERSERNLELVNGRIYLVTGANLRHGVMTTLLAEALAPSARARGCRRFMHGRLVRTGRATFYAPDVLITCGRIAHDQYETDPTLIIEVASPSTRNVDRREKAAAYAKIASLHLLLLVDPDERRIEGARMVDGEIGGWDVYGPGDLIITDFGDLNIDVLYDALDQETGDR